MERNRDFRRGSVAAGVNGLPRRRQRISTLKDSADDGRQVELKDTVRLRDRERLQKKERDREFAKRRRVDRAVVHQRSGGGGGGGGGGDSYRENESTDSSDEEYFEGEVETKNLHQHKGMNQLSPTSSSLSNNRRLLRTHRSAPVFRSPSDEIFGVPVPRRTRSASAKRLQQCWISGKIVFGEDLSHRTFSPATVSSSGFDDDSPSSSSASMRKKMKSAQPRGRNFSTASHSKPSSIQDDIEIEVVEALFDLMKQSHSHSQSSQIQEKADRDSPDTVNCELQRPKPVGVENENTAFSVQNEQSRETNGETIVVDSIRDLNKKERKAEKEKSPDDRAQEIVGGDGFVNKGTLGSPKENESPSCVDKVNACDIKDPTTTKAEHAAAAAKEEFRLEIDLMASPPPEKEKDAVVDMENTPKVMSWAVQNESGAISQDGTIGLHKGIGVAADRSQVPEFEKSWDDILILNNWTTQLPQGQKEQRNQSSSLFSFPIGMSTWPSYTPHPGSVPHLQTAMLVDGSTRLSSMAIRPPQFKLPLPRPRRCTTHQYIAKNITHHMDLMKKAFSSGPTSSVASYGTDSDPKPMFPFPPILGGRGKDKSPVSAGAFSPVTSAKPAIQQPGNPLVYPGLMFPLGHHHTSMMAPAISSGPPNSAVGNASLTGNSSGKPSANLSTAGGTTVVSYNNQRFPSNGTAPYMTILQNNGGPIPISTNIPIPSFKGGSSCMPILNSSVYPSAFNVNNQQSSFIGSSSRKQPERQQQTRIVGENKTSTSAAAHPTVQPIWPSYSSSKFEPEIDGKSSSPILADGRVSHSAKPNNQTGSFPAQPMNFAVIPPLSMGGGGAVGNKNGNHSQQGSKNRVELMPQAFALPFSANPSSNPAAAANFSSMLQNQAVFQMLPDMARNGTQMAQQKNFQPSEGKFPSNADHSFNFSKSDGTDMPSSSMMPTSIFDTLPRTVNYLPSSLSANQPFLLSSAALTSGPNFQQLHQQQQFTQLQQHHVHQMQLAGTPQVKASPPNSIPGSLLNNTSFPSNGPAFSAQTDISKWMNLPRTQPQEASSQPAASALGSIPQLKIPQGQTHLTLQRQHLTARGQPESPSMPSSNSSISKQAGSSGILKAMPSVSALPLQEAGTSPNGATSQKSPPACRRNIPSILSSHPNQLSELKY